MMNSASEEVDLSLEQSPSLKSPHISTGPGCMLPDIRSSENSVDKRAPLPTSLQADFIPEDILLSLVAPPNPQEVLGPGGRHRNLHVSTIAKRKPPANVWHHPARREKFKHLTENTPCICGSGRDISFLYDSTKKPESGKVDVKDKSSVRVKVDKDVQIAQQGNLKPETLIPEEYHIIKSKGVIGLEYIDDKFTTQPMDHDKHLVMFPSMNPTSRSEVRQLKRTMQDMIERMGINDVESEMKGPSQMHNLIELIKKEQNIYNLIFHEIIRQVSVESMDRGELLSALRDQYSQLLNKVPCQIKGLHEEMLAQRALDRRLTEEVGRFKSAISVLTSELANVKEHDVEVTEQANKALEELSNALSESEKNTGLLTEYHSLYELQRKRLEKHVALLTGEKELWSNAAYSLALKVTEEHALNTARQLHVSEKAWAKVAHHFSLLLSEKDTEELTKLQGFVDSWRDSIEAFDKYITDSEQDVRKALTEIQESVQEWIRDFKKTVLNKYMHVSKPPSREKVIRLHNDIKKWVQLINLENEKFVGDSLLTGQQLLRDLAIQVEGWTDCMLKVFLRHRSTDGANYSEHNKMTELNELIEVLRCQYATRLSGENGVASGLTSITNGLDMWESKLHVFLYGSKGLQDDHWGMLYTMLTESLSQINSTMRLVGTTQTEESRLAKHRHKHTDRTRVILMTQKWLSSTTNGIESEDDKITEEVSTLHTGMVKWMVHMLLRLAPDNPCHSKEAKDAIFEENKTAQELIESAEMLFVHLSAFSKYLSTCCNEIVMRITEENEESHEDDPDHEARELRNLKKESDDWIVTAKLLLGQLIGKKYEEPQRMAVTSPGTDELDDEAQPQVFAEDETKPEEQEQEQEQEQPPSPKSHPLLDTDPHGSRRPPSVLSDVISRTPSPLALVSGSPILRPKKKSYVVPRTPPNSMDAEYIPEVTVVTEAPVLEDVPEVPVVKIPQVTAVAEDVLEVQVVPRVPVEPIPEAKQEDEPQKDLDGLQVIGYDGNTRPINEQNKFNVAKTEETANEFGDIGPFSPIIALNEVHEKLRAAEERAQFAEEKIVITEADLLKANMRIEALTEKLERRKLSIPEVDESPIKAKIEASAVEKSEDGQPTDKDVRVSSAKTVAAKLKRNSKAKPSKKGK